MSIDFQKIQMSSLDGANKVLLEDSGSFSVPDLPGAGDVFGIATIPFPYDNDQVIAQVWTNGGGTDGTVLPWSSNDNRVIQYHYIEGTELKIVCIHSDSSGFGFPAGTINYFYRILIP